MAYTIASKNKKRKMKILVLDDDQAMLDVIAKKLQDKNYEVITRTDPIKALGVIYSHSIDLIISDILMPGVSGYALMNLLKQFHCKIPIILISSLDEKEVIMATRDLETAAIISKPINFQELFLKIEKVKRENKLVKE